MKKEFKKVLEVSTANISQETSDLLEHAAKDLSPSDTLPFRVASHHYGFIIFPYSTMDKEDQKIIRDKIPELFFIIAHALNNNCSIINLDRDADTLKGFKTFKW